MKYSSLIYLIAGGVLSVFAIVGTMDAEDEQREFEHYCYMVENEFWPDFRDLADECGIEKIRVSKDLRDSEDW